MADDLAKQVDDIEAENERVKNNVKDREAALGEQIGELGELSNLRDKKGDQDRELEMLDKEIEDLGVQTKRYGSDIRALQDEKEELTEQVDALDTMLQRREDENADLEADLARADRQIDFLQGEIAKQGHKKPNKNFNMKKGDMLDELLGSYVNETGCPVPIKRLGNGFYMFGSRKIFAKVLNGRLVIRVGGGYMVIEEFISSYAEGELRKAKAKE